MNNDELLELRRMLTDATENNDWSAIDDAISFLDEFIEFDDESDEL
jgi:hypothetical protein